MWEGSLGGQTLCQRVRQEIRAWQTGWGVGMTCQLPSSRTYVQHIFKSPAPGTNQSIYQSSSHKNEQVLEGWTRPHINLTSERCERQPPLCSWPLCSFFHSGPLPPCREYTFFLLLVHSNLLCRVCFLSLITAKPSYLVLFKSYKNNSITLKALI